MANEAGKVRRLVATGPSEAGEQQCVVVAIPTSEMVWVLGVKCRGEGDVICGTGGAGVGSQLTSDSVVSAIHLPRLP